ncbi:hypothetical protein PQU92_12415 [Asticcacaulis sp. BYS171W]|uniref:Uncharacterized protein n=1 Tax=Asticcacaulis aquaticus TaxID=2984212 RepID=A0ABT5HVI4_9CAUL|nr:hypothetical protein [Asticcacaulis aquaticus]MDC7684085.1 hypothetical protein [Asticcacaulis aquaticus]
MADSNLTGVWAGRYTYPYGWGDEHFTAVLMDIAGGISGTIHETVLQFVAQATDVNAFVDGSREGSLVTFSKTYDGSAGWSHTVSYRGMIKDEGYEISGIWTVDDMTGTFLMVRRKRPDVAETIQTGILQDA